MKKFLLVLLALFCLAGTAGAEDLLVRRVVDGDTLVLESGGKIRLIGIDTPESSSNQKAKKDSRRTGQSLAVLTEMGKRSKYFLEELVRGKKITLEYDAQKKDRYGRLLAYVYIEEKVSKKIENADLYRREPGGPVFVNATLARAGYASPMTIPPNVKYADLFTALAREARTLKRGLWKD